MSAADSSSNDEAPTRQVAPSRNASSGLTSAEPAPSDPRREAVIEDQLRAELGELAEIALPTGSSAPGAARIFTAHCLSGLIAPRILHDTELLVSELVTNSLDHGQLGGHDTVVIRIYLAADALRLEIENAGTAGVIAVVHHSDRSAGRGGFGLELVEHLATRWGVNRGHGTTVWFEMGRA